MDLKPFWRSFIVGVTLGVLVQTSAVASPADVAPADWSRISQGENVIYRAPDRNELMMFRSIKGADSPKAMAEAASAALAKAWNGDLDGSINQAAGDMAVYAFKISDGNQAFIGRSYAFKESPGSFFTMVHVAPADADGLDARFEETERKMSALAMAVLGDAGQTDANVAETSSPSGPGAIPKGLETMLMTYVYGVGSISVKTHYLFDDGRVCSCTELAPDDAAASLATRDVNEIGEWQADGERYRIRKPGKKKWRLLKKPLHAAALPKDWRGQGTYRTIDTFGGVTTGFPQYFTGVWSDVTLRADGTFATGGGAMASGSEANVSTAMGRKDATETGTYQIDGLTLMLRFDDGREERTSIAWDGVAKKGEDPFETIWIRGSAFQRVDGS